MVKRKATRKALVKLVYNTLENSWHPVVYISVAPASGSISKTKFAASKYRETGFYVRANALKAIVDDQLIPSLYASGCDQVFKDFRQSHEDSWSGVGPPRLRHVSFTTESLDDVVNRQRDIDKKKQEVMDRICRADTNI